MGLNVGEPPSAPSDPDGFRAAVLRRAVRLERRRRRGKVAAWMLGAVASAAALALLARTAAVPRPSTNIATASPPTLPARVIARGGMPLAAAAGPDGAMWVAESDGPEGRAALVRFGSGTASTTIGLPVGTSAGGVVAGSDGAVWVSQPGAARIVRVDLAGHATALRLPAASSMSLTVGVDGRVWLASASADELIAVDPTGHAATYPVPQGRSPDQVASGPDGSIWFGEGRSPHLGSMSTSGTVRELDLPDASDRVTALADGPGPSLWFAAAGRGGGAVGRVTAHDGIDLRPITQDAPRAMSVGPDGQLWFAGPSPGTVGEVGLGSSRTQRLASDADADALALGADGSMWMVDRSRQMIVRIDS